MNTSQIYKTKKKNINSNILNKGERGGIWTLNKLTKA